VLAPESYAPVFFHSVLFLTIAVCLRLRGGRIGGAGTEVAFWGLGATVILFLGLRPVAVQFGDTMNYASAYAAIPQGEPPTYEWGFSALMRICSNVVPVEQFLLLCTAVYVLSIMYAIHLRHPGARVETLVAFIGAFSFYAYGVNGVRSGMAASLFIAAVASDGPARRVLLMVAATSIHKSALLMVIAWIVTSRLPNPRAWSAAWCAALALSVVAGARLSTLVSSMPGLATDERAQVYFSPGSEDSTGLRLDFVAYSIVPVLATERLVGSAIWTDRFYVGLRNLYLALNAFWLMTMHAAYTNRFAYLSWCLLPWVSTYPFLPVRRRAGWKRVRRADPRRLEHLSAVLLASVAFTYFMMMYVYPSRDR